jgi:dipeptidyl aminopeptidase/acylaminoacyl peptidase
MGYAVLVPEFRSSAAFGHQAITDDRIHHDLVARDVADIVAGVDSLIAEGLIDPERTAVFGHSAGGRRANWLTVSTHRFRAVVSKEGWADEWLMSGVETLARLQEMYGGPPVLVPENYQKDSALFHARGATTPTLFLMGNPQHGGVDRYDTVRWLHNALRAQGVQSQYISYPDEGHVLMRRANRLDALERTAAWIDRFCK